MATRSKQRVLRSGVVIAEKYRVDEAVARGGFSVIYRGTHIEMQRPVALKLLAIDDEIKPTWLERFTREARLASQLTHANTVTIFDYGQDARGFLYIAMEWVEGVSLYQHLKTHGPLSAREVAEVTAQILQSLDEAHQRGFLHRDLKPSNIMLSHDYEGQDLVKVLDFGIAKHLEDGRQQKGAARITHQGAFIGTPRYASPEQLDSKELTPAADIYSLGLLMWEALVGDPAVSSIEYGDCVRQHLGPDPWRLPDSVQCPPGLAAILYRALEKPVERRYRGCRQMHGEVMAWLGSDEAREQGGQDFFLDAGMHGGFEPAMLGGESSGVDEEELFAGLGDENSEHDDAPLDIHGPSSSGVGFEAGAPAPVDNFGVDDLGVDRFRADDFLDDDSGDDSFDRELREIAADASRRARSETPPALEPVRQVSPPAARPSGSLRPPRHAGTSDQSKKTLIVSALAAALIVGAGAYALFSGDESEPAAASQDVAAKEGAQQTPAEIAAAKEAAADDGSATYAARMLWQAISETKWRRIGEVDVLEFSDVTQSSARFRKQTMTVTVTIYETDSHLSAEQYLATAKEPSQAIRFGKTVVHVGPGAKGNSTRGVYDLMSTLFQLKAIAKEQAELK